MKTESPPHPVVLKSKPGTPGATVAPIPGSLRVVRFDAHPQTFAMVYLACENPRCPCRDVVVSFLEETNDGQARKSGLEFGFRLNTNNWRITELLGRSPRVDVLVREFQDGFSEDVKKDILACYTSFRKAVRSAASFKASAKNIRSGRLFSAVEVFGFDETSTPGALGSPFLTVFEENTYRLDDFYCLNPSCPCQETHLNVLRLKAANDPLEEPAYVFTVRYGFAEKAEFTKLAAGVSPDWGGRLLTHWIETSPSAVGNFLERYKRLKEVGKRLVKKRRRR